jgi:O-antigen ligase
VSSVQAPAGSALGVSPRAIQAGILVAGVLLALLSGAAIGFGLLLPGIVLGLLPAALLLLHYPFAAILLWVLVMPYFLELSTEAGPATWGLHRLMVPGMLVVIAIYGVLGIRRVAFRVHPYDFAIAAFLVLGVVNILVFGPNPIRFLVAFYDKVTVPIMLFWLVRAIGLRNADLGRLVLVGLITIAVQGAIGALSWFAPSLLPDAWVGRAGERATGTFGGPAPFTITLVFFGLLALHWVGQRRTLLDRVVLAGGAIAAFLGAFISLSRGSWLGALAAFLGLALIYPRLVARLAVVGLVIGVVLAVGPLQPIFAYAQQRVEDEATLESRIITNDAAMRIVGERPLTGVGFGNFERFDEQYKERVGDIPLKLGGSAHNTYLNMAAELGLPMTVLYFIPPLALLAATVSLRRRLPRAGPLGWGLLIVLWCALLDQFVVSNFLEMIHAYLWGTSLWWLTLGLIATVIDLRQSPTPEPSSASP